jgi:hypothetical protein
VTATNWTGATVPAMWSSAVAADTPEAWQQVMAWQRTYELLVHHAGRLKACRDELTYVWPSERSPAATAFIEYIDVLLVQIGRAQKDAVENRGALAGVLTSMSVAKADIAKLKAEWDKHEVEDANMAANLPNDLFASGDNWQEPLNEKARTRMAQNDQEVLEATRLMVEMTGPWDGRETEPRGPFDTESGMPAAQSVERGVGQAGSGSGSGVSPGPVMSVLDVDRGAGLSGSMSTPLPPLSNTAQTSGSPSPAASGSHVATPLPPIGNRSSRPVSLIRPSGSGLGARPNGNSSGAVGRAVFGSTLPFAAGPAGSRSGHGVAVSKVNPVGGVIGGGNYGTHGVNGIPFGAAGRFGSGTDAAHEPALTLQWEVPEGVPPVIKPGQDRPFELGPGVIGLDEDPCA